MKLEQEILSKLVIHNKYSRYLPDKKRRETWNEIVDRNVEMHVDKFPEHEDIIRDAFEFVREKKVLPSMRASQFAGKPIQKNPSRIFNCSFIPIDDIEAFSEAMFLLLGGTGVGYSVQYHHVRQLPNIQKSTKEQRYLISDDIIGWSDAIKELMRAYLDPTKTTMPKFDYSDIRPKGSRLVTAGGKAPGPEPLRKCIENVKSILEKKENGEGLTTLEVHDIVCYIADAVLAGGIRRAALICLFSFDDEKMRKAKAGEWWKDNPQRGRANNSAVAIRSRITKEDFHKLWEDIKEGGSGEPGIFFSNDKSSGTNPCCEASLRPNTFCNLCDINGATVKDQEDFEERVWAASVIGTLQATYTDFHYLRPIWKENTEKDALLGIGITGIGSGKLKDIDLKKGAEHAKDINSEFAYKFNINPAARVTVVKPSGTSSLVLGTSSGIHAWHDNYYIRRLQLPKDDTLYQYLSIKIPQLVNDYKRLENTAVAEIPLSAPETAHTRDESALKFLERVKRFNLEWVRGGHRRGMNEHNVSATVNIRDGEWKDVRDWMWENRETFNGLSILPFDGGSYEQAPFETIDKETYEEMRQYLNDVDLTEIKEDADYTELKETLACGAGGCTITSL
jgi:ribonucleoside-diphosphate reductase alpha chain